MTAILEWLGGKVAGPAATLCALVLSGGLIWQTARIDGWPLIGGGLKAQVAGLQQLVEARDLAEARAQSAAWRRAPSWPMRRTIRRGCTRRAARRSRPRFKP